METLAYLLGYVAPFFWAAAKLIGLAVLAGFVSSLAFRLMGGLKRRLVLLTGAIGVPLHEISHALVATVFGMRVREIRLFQPDPQSPQLGYVNFSYSPSLVRHRVGLFFVGIAPLVAGSAAATLLLQLAGADLPLAGGLPELTSFPYLLITTHNMVVDRFSAGIGSGALAFVATAVALHSAPSWADLKHAGVGLLTGITLLLFLMLPAAAMLAEQTEIGPKLQSGFLWAESAIAQTGFLMMWAGLVLGALFLPVRVLAWLFTRQSGKP